MSKAWPVAPETSPSVTRPRSSPVYALSMCIRDSLCGSQRGAGVGQDRPAHLGRCHRAAGAVEQGLPHLLLQLADLGAEAGLGQVQPGGGAGEAALFDDGDEVAQLTELHKQRF